MAVSSLGRFRQEDCVTRSTIFNLLAAVLRLLANASATPIHLRCEYRENLLGIDTAIPHLSWQSDSTERNWKQSAYQVSVASSEDRLRAGTPDVWDSGKIDSDESVGIAYHGPRLESRQRYYWKVRVWDGAGNVTESAEPEARQKAKFRERYRA